MAKQKESARFDGYAVELFLDEDNDWLAHLVELPGISAFGSTPEPAGVAPPERAELAGKNDELSRERLSVLRTIRRG